jgi:hypothetical protein
MESVAAISGIDLILLAILENIVLEIEMWSLISVGLIADIPYVREILYFLTGLEEESSCAYDEVNKKNNNKTIMVVFIVVSLLLL